MRSFTFPAHTLDIYFSEEKLDTFIKVRLLILDWSEFSPLHQCIQGRAAYFQTAHYLLDRQQYVTRLTILPIVSMGYTKRGKQFNWNQLDISQVCSPIEIVSYPVGFQFPCLFKSINYCQYLQSRNELCIFQFLYPDVFPWVSNIIHRDMFLKPLVGILSYTNVTNSIVSRVGEPVYKVHMPYSLLGNSKVRLFF